LILPLSERKAARHAPQVATSPPTTPARTARTATTKTAYSPFSLLDYFFISGCSPTVHSRLSFVLFFQMASTACSPCAAGKYMAAGRTTCKLCDSGTYSSLGSVSCANCNAGQYQVRSLFVTSPSPVLRSFCSIYVPLFTALPICAFRPPFLVRSG
jgi:hypothetical protein